MFEHEINKTKIRIKGTWQLHYTMDVFHFDEVRYKHIPFQGDSLMAMYSQCNKQQGLYISS